jgi:ligand-binding sensor domain-containing protein
VWVGGSQGVLCVVGTDDGLKCPAVALGKNAATIWSLAEAQDGSIWIGQVGRINRVGDNTVRTWTVDEGFPRFQSA